MYLHLLILISTIVINIVKCQVYRLPENVKPVRYILTMEPHLEPDVSPVPYEGSVVIQLNVTESTRNITFHKRKLNIDESSIQVVSFSGTAIKVSGISENKEDETYTINMENDIVKDVQYNLTIGNFANNLGDQNVGFYLAKYSDKNHAERRLAVTDFEPTDARMAFPCFDEPGIKAKFIINIIRKAEHNSVSNEVLESSTELGNSKFLDTFKETPEMSAYVVAFIVSDYKHTEKVERHRIFGKPEDVKSSEGFKYSLDIAVKTLLALEEYTGIKFPLSKMDQFAVPDQYFKDNAMENWGLVIYGESHLLCTNHSAAEDLKRCTSYIAHEFTHQWFGNLVTPAWWDYTWLSESFAAYFQYYITSIVQPTWNFMDMFTIDNLHLSLAAEETLDSAPLNYVTKMSGEFPPLHVIYAKGSSLIRMMQHVLTESVFKKGLQIFLENKKFSTAEPSDLYSALQKSVDDAGVNGLLEGKSVEEIMTTWDSVRGFPIVTVTRDYTNGNVLFEQDYRYKKALHLQISSIPLNYIFQSNDPTDFLKTTADIWLTEKSMTLNRSFQSDGWLIVNKQQAGYYRVNYDRENWERIINFMNTDNFKAIHVLNRAQLISDAFNLAEMGYILFDIPFRLCSYLVQEKEYIPYAAFYSSISEHRFQFFDERLNTNFFQNFASKNISSASNKKQGTFQDYLKIVLSGVLNYLGLEAKQSDSLMDKLNRQEMVRCLCRGGHPVCIQYSLEKLKEVKENSRSRIPPEIEEIVFCTGMKNSTKEEFDSLYHMYKASIDIYQRQRLRNALDCNSKFTYLDLLVV